MKQLTRFVLILAISAAACAPAQTASPANPSQPSPKPAEPTIVANPALWQVKGPHATIYLFGSIHVMKPNVDWQTAKVKSAFAASDTLYLEVGNLDDVAALQLLAMKYGLDAAHPLSTKLSKDDIATLDTAVKSVGLPGESLLEPMQPWLVSATLDSVPVVKAGYQPNSGIDVKLLTQAKADQKKIAGFETLEQQIHLLADEPQPQQVEMLHKELAELDKSAAEMNGLVQDWEHGDVDAIGKMENDELKAKYPAEYQRLVVDRNTRWASTLDGLLKDPATGTVFVVVGAAHFAGPDSVIKMLEKDGWKVEREE